MISDMLPGAGAVVLELAKAGDGADETSAATAIAVEIVRILWIPGMLTTVIDQKTA